jgi:hypothetical protein
VRSRLPARRGLERSGPPGRPATAAPPLASRSGATCTIEEVGEPLTRTNAEAICEPPSTSTLRTPCSPRALRVSSAAARPMAAVPPDPPDLEPRRLQRGRVRRIADHHCSARPARTPAAPGGTGTSVQHDPQRLRTVVTSQADGPGAGRRRAPCRDPTSTASERARRSCTARARAASPVNHRDAPVRGSHPAVEADGELDRHERADPRASERKNAAFCSRPPARQDSDVDVDAGGAQTAPLPPSPSASGIGRGDRRRATTPGGDERLATGSRAPSGGRRAPGWCRRWRRVPGRARGAQGDDLGVRAPGRAGAIPRATTSPSRDHTQPTSRVGMGGPARMLRQRDRAPHEPLVVLSLSHLPVAAQRLQGRARA